MTDLGVEACHHCITAKPEQTLLAVTACRQPCWSVLLIIRPEEYPALQPRALFKTMACKPVCHNDMQWSVWHPLILAPNLLAAYRCKGNAFLLIVVHKPGMHQ